MMLTVEQVKEKLKDRNLQEVARRVELHYATVYKVANGGNVSYETVKKLSDYLTEIPAAV